jgi:tetratricopeptide (TPR) repeat protein
MFILVPLLLILVSAIGIGLIVWRKMPYLKKLSTEHHELDDNLLYAYFPEIINKFKGIPWTEYKELWLVETEKLLRKLRVLSMKIDRTMDLLISRIRLIYESEETIGDKKEEVVLKEEARSEPVDLEIDLKRQEQMLIVEIAKNPKDASLYKSLGELYEKMNSLEDAKESYQTAASLSPNDDIIRIKLSKIIEKIEEKKGIDGAN